MRYRVHAVVLLCSSLAAAQPSEPESSPSPPSEEVLDLTADPESRYQSPESPPQKEPQEPASTAAPPASAPAAEATAPASTAAPAEPIPTNDASTPSSTPGSPEAESSSADSPCGGQWVRNGFYLRSVSGAAYVSVTGQGPVGDAALSGLGALSTVAIGGAIVPGLVFAGTLETSTVTTEFEGGPFASATVTTDDDSYEASPNATAAHLQLGALVDWYPDPTAGWHVGLGGGLGLLSVVSQANNGPMVGMGASGSVVGGYDWLIGRKWSLGLGLRISASAPMELRDEDGDDTGYELAPWSVGLGGSILYH